MHVVYGFVDVGQIAALPDAPAAVDRGATAAAFDAVYSPGPAKSSNEFTDIDAECC